MNTLTDTMHAELVARLAFPAAETLEELFEDMVVVADYKADPIGDTDLNQEICDTKTKSAWCKGTKISSYCSTLRMPGEHSWLRVKPTQKVIDHISSRAVSDYDSFSFQMVKRSDGSVLVVAQSSKILQSLWLAVVSLEAAQVYKRELAG